LRVFSKRAEQAAQLTGGKIFRNYHEMLASKDLDSILIATPEHWHYQMIVDTDDPSHRRGQESRLEDEGSQRKVAGWGPRHPTIHAKRRTNTSSQGRTWIGTRGFNRLRSGRSMPTALGVRAAIGITQAVSRATCFSIASRA
jgi:hypothetical protein